MPKVLSYEAIIRGGAQIQNKLVVPVLSSNPPAPQEGQVWINTGSKTLSVQSGGATVALTQQSLDTEAVQDIIGSTLRGGNNLAVTYDDVANIITLDVDTLTSADITDFIAAVRGAITGATTPTAATTFSTGGAISVAVTDSPNLGGNAPAFYRNTDNHTSGTANKVFTTAEQTKLTGIATGATANATDAFLTARANHTGTQTASTISDFNTALDTLFDGINTATANTSVNLVTVDPGTPTNPADDFQRMQVTTTVTDSPKLGGNVPAFYTNTDNHTSGTNNKVFTAAEQTKLTGIQAGATANATDAFLRDRTNHTGTQLAATISDFITAARDAISVTDSPTLDLNYVAGVLSAAVLDAPRLGGQDSAFHRNVDNHTEGISATGNRLFKVGDRTKLDGIATGATANATDAALRDRATHTGTQVAATISDFAAAVAAVPNLDADTLNNLTAAQIQQQVTNAIVNAAPGTLDTLNELAAALGNDPNFATSITTALNARSRNFTAALAGAAVNATTNLAIETITHNLGTRNLIATVYVDGESYQDEEYLIRRPTVNTIEIVSEGAPIPAPVAATATSPGTPGRRVVIHAVGNAA